MPGPPAVPSQFETTQSYTERDPVSGKKKKTSQKPLYFCPRSISKSPPSQQVLTRVLLGLWLLTIREQGRLSSSWGCSRLRSSDNSACPGASPAAHFSFLLGFASHLEGKTCRYTGAGSPPPDPTSNPVSQYTRSLLDSETEWDTQDDHLFWGYPAIPSKHTQ